MLVELNKVCTCWTVLEIGNFFVLINLERTTIQRIRKVQTWLQSKPSMWIHNLAAEKVLVLFSSFLHAELHSSRYHWQFMMLIQVWLEQRSIHQWISSNVIFLQQLHRKLDFFNDLYSPRHHLLYYQWIECRFVSMINRNRSMKLPMLLLNGISMFRQIDWMTRVLIFGICSFVEIYQWKERKKENARIFRILSVCTRNTHIYKQ